MEPSLQHQNFLIQELGDSGDLPSARSVFTSLKAPNVFSWTMIMTACINNDDSQSALHLYSEMLLTGTKPDKIIFLTALRACKELQDVNAGIWIHGHICELGWESDAFLASTLISMYGSFSCVGKSLDIFLRSRVTNVVLWNAMIAAYAHSGHYSLGARLLREMDLEGVPADAVTYSTLLEGTDSRQQASLIHSRVVTLGYDRLVGDSLVSTYCRLGDMESACKAFERTSFKSIFSWTSLITGYSQHGCGKKAFKCLQRMDLEGMKANEVTYISLLGSCTSLEQGESIQWRLSASQLESCVELGNALIAMHAGFGSLGEAKRLFEQVDRNVVTWNTLMSGYSKHGLMGESVNLFRVMDLEGVASNDVTFLAVLESCPSLEAGRNVYQRIVSLGYSCTTVLNAAVAMFTRCGSLEDAKFVFDRIVNKTVVSFTSMVAAYAQFGYPHQALDVYTAMQEQGIIPDRIALAYILSICHSDPMLSSNIERILANRRETDLSVMNSLVNLHAKCGDIAKAQQVFDSMIERDIFSWTTIITSYAQRGHTARALRLLREMEMEGVGPEDVTFLSVLHSCSHAGVVEQSRLCFLSMISDHGLVGSAEHYNCMVDVFSRAGWLGAAEELLRNMPFEPGASAWKTFLAACRMYCQMVDAKTVDVAAKVVSEIEPQSSLPYLMLSSMNSEQFLDRFNQ